MYCPGRAGASCEEDSEVAPPDTEMLSRATWATGDALLLHDPPLYQLARAAGRSDLVGETCVAASVGIVDFVDVELRFCSALLPCCGSIEVLPDPGGCDALALDCAAEGSSLFGLLFFRFGPMRVRDAVSSRLSHEGQDPTMRCCCGEQMM